MGFVPWRCHICGWVSAGYEPGYVEREVLASDNHYCPGISLTLRTEYVEWYPCEACGCETFVDLPWLIGPMEIYIERFCDP